MKKKERIRKFLAMFLAFTMLMADSSMTALAEVVGNVVQKKEIEVQTPSETETESAQTEKALETELETQSESKSETEMQSELETETETETEVQTELESETETVASVFDWSDGSTQITVEISGGTLTADTKLNVSGITQDSLAYEQLEASLTENGALTASGMFAYLLGLDMPEGEILPEGLSFKTTMSFTHPVLVPESMPEQETADTGEVRVSVNGTLVSAETQMDETGAVTALSFTMSELGDVAIARVSGEKEEPNTKVVYTYEDSDISVTATLSNADVVPDDAEFKVTQVTPGSGGYNYDAYMQALNENEEAVIGESDGIRATEDGEAFNEKNTLLYDMAFLVDKTDENGNKIENEKVEYEPEEGTVQFSFRFKNRQLTKQIGVKDAEDVAIVHLPLDAATRESVDTTAAATSISAENIAVEVVDGASVGANRASFELSGLSIAAVINNGKLDLQSGTNLNFKQVLGNAVYFGIVANTVKKQAHMDSNFATKALYGVDKDGVTSVSGNVTTGVYTANGGVYVIGSVPKGGTLQMDGKSNLVWCTEADKNKFKVEGTIETYPKEVLDAYVASMIRHVSTEAATIAGEKKCYDVNSIVINGQSFQNNKTIDITGCGAGTYYFDMTSYAQNGIDDLNIKKHANQTIVFNYPTSTSVTLKRFSLEQDGKSISSATSDATVDMLCRSIIFNMPAATSVHFASATAGLFLAPKAKVESLGGTSSGWIVVDDFTNNGGEWHCVYGELPKPEEIHKPTEESFQVSKTVDGQTPTENQKFIFQLEQTGIIPEGTQKIPTFTVVNDGADVDFGTISYTKEGTYYYKITEEGVAEGTSGKYTLDQQSYIVKVVVTAHTDTSGSLTTTTYEKETTYYKGQIVSDCTDVNKVAGAVFNNRTKPADVTLTLKGHKNIKNLDNKAGYTFELYAKGADGHATGDVLASGVSDADGNVALTKDGHGLTYTIEDLGDSSEKVYHYILKEQIPAGAIDGVYNEIHYDTDEIEVAVTLYKEDGALKLKVNGNEVFGDVYDLEVAGTFTNYKMKTTSVQIQVKKEIEGRLTPSYKDFTFTITNIGEKHGYADGEFKKTYQSNYTTVKGAGTASFAPIYFNEAGTYRYLVSEQAWDPTDDGYKGYTRDTDIYEVRVEVSENLGTLTASVFYQKVNENGTAIDGTQAGGTTLPFTNSYRAEDVSLILKAHKKVENLPSKAGYIFDLYAKDVNGQAAGDVLASGVSDTDGDVLLTKNGQGLIYRAEDLKDGATERTYEYILKERIPAGVSGDIHYDEREIPVTVKLTKEKDELKLSVNGMAVSESVYDLGEGGTFMNYRPTTTSAEIKVQKTFEGNPPTNKEFIFVLKNVGDMDGYTSDAFNEKYTSKIQKVTITGSGIAGFDKIYFNEAGTYRYQVVEENWNPEDTSYAGYSKDAGVYYVTIQVKEENKALKAKLFWIREEGTKKTEGTVTEGSTSLAFRNRYETNETSYVLPVTKTFALNGPDERTWTTDRRFTFELKADGETAGYLRGQEGDIPFEAQEVTVAGAATGYFPAIIYKTAGEYTYTLSEKPFGTEQDYTGFERDSKIYTITVTVKDINGCLDVTAVKAKEKGPKTDSATEAAEISKETGVVFTNTYATEGTSWSLPVTKAIEDYPENGTVAREFTFELSGNDGYKDEAYSEVFDSSTVQVKGIDTKTFAPIYFNQAGEYTYTLKECASQAEGYTDDPEKYTVKVTVKDINSKLTVTRVVYHGDSETAEDVVLDAGDVTGITFTNTYRAADTDVTIPVEKSVEGISNEQAKGKTFTFYLYRTGADWTIGEAASPADEVQLTLGADGAAEGNFAKRLYSMDTSTASDGGVGTYYYVVKEATAGESFAENTTEYHYTVEISDDGSGILKKAVTLEVKEGDKVTEQENDNLTAAFTNRWVETSLTLKAHKAVKNLESKAGYGFNLYLKGADGKAEGQSVAEGTSDENGDVYLSGLIYRLADLNGSATRTYEYVLKEEIPAEADENHVYNDIRYDTMELPVTVTVTYQDGVLKLHVNGSEVTSDAYDLGEAGTFTNYRLVTTSAQIHVEKRLEGIAESDKQFTFVLEKSGNKDGYTSEAFDTAYTAETKTVVVTGSGHASFATIYFNQVGTYKYLISEQAWDPAGGNYQGYTRDTSVYEVTIEVTEENAMLHAAVSYQKKDADEPATESINANETTLLFVNRYQAADTEVIIPVEKNIAGLSGKAAEKTFGFELYEADSDWQIGEGAAQAISVTTDINGRGTGCFAALKYSSDETEDNVEGGAGTYYYVVKEVPAGESFAENLMEYRYTVTVTDDGSGKLKKTVTVEVKEGDEVTGQENDDLTAAFTNRWIETSLALKAHKAVENLDSKAGYILDLYAKGADGKASGAVLAEGISGEDGTVTLDKLIYRLADLDKAPEKTYEYVLKERIPDEAAGNVYNNVYYDETEIPVTVVVMYEDGMLKLTVNGEVLSGTVYDLGEAGTFTNYRPTATTARIQVQKNFEGNPPTEKQFTFALTKIGEKDGYTDNKFQKPYAQEKQEVTVTGAETKAFDTIYFDEAGVYQYQVVEENWDTTDESYAGYSKDGSVYKVTVNVTEENKALKAEVRWEQTADAAGNEMKGELAEGNTLSFRNRYATGETSYSIPVTKAFTLNGPDAENWHTDRQFTFELRAADASKPAGYLTRQTKDGGELVPFAAQEVTITGAGTEYFPEITYKDSGVYTYIMTEKPFGTKQNYDGFGRDNTVYTITLKVEDKNSYLCVTEVKAVAEGSDAEQTELDKETGVVFKNTYTTKGTSWSLPVTKVISGYPESGTTVREFTFKLSGNGGYKDEAYSEKFDSETATVQGSGSARFNTIYFKQAGVYTYTLEELASNADGYTYDTNQYTVRVTVEDVESKLTVTRVVYRNSDSEAAEEKTLPDGDTVGVTFTNTYRAADTDFAVKVKKTVDGITAERASGKTFTFRLYRTDEDWKVSDASQQIDAVTVTLGADGTAEKTFGKRLYTINPDVISDGGTGTYYYVVKEDPSGYGFADNATEYRYCVNVTDDGAGTLQKKIQVWKGEKDQKESQTAEYVNRYAEEGTAELCVAKTYTGEEWPEEGFAFVLEGISAPTDTIPMPEGSTGNRKELMVHNDTPASFGLIRYTENGTYEYQITETAGDGKITYDTTVYKVKVIVSDGDKADGTSKVRVLYMTTSANDVTESSYQEMDGQVFTASFKNEALGDLKIAKTVSVGGETDRDFTFTVKIGGELYNGSASVFYTDSEEKQTIIVEDGVIRLKHGQNAVIADIPYGTTWEVTEMLTEGYVVNPYDGVINGTISSDMAFADFVNTQLQGLTITKTRRGGHSDDLFTFEVEIAGEPYSGAVTITSAGATRTEQITGGILKLKGGDTAQITGLYPNTKYKVTEHTADGYIAAVGETQTAEAAGEIAADGTSVVEFVNTKKQVEAKFSKTAVGATEELKGGVFQIIDQDAEEGEASVKDEWTSDGSIHTASLEVGRTYAFHEVSAPEGYMKAKDIVFRLTNEGSLEIRQSDETFAKAEDSLVRMEDTITSVKVSKVDIYDSAELAGAKMQIRTSEGSVIREWISRAEPEEITGLTPGVVYTLHEAAAPKGYDLAADATFVLGEDGTIDRSRTTAMMTSDGVLLVEDHMTANATIEVTKRLVYNNADLMAFDQTFYVALYSDEACTQRVSDVKAIVFKNAATSTVKFTNLEVKQKYYIAECNVTGVAQTSGVMADGSVYQANFTEGYSAIVTEPDGMQTVYFENVFYTLPEGFYKEGELTITKKLLGVDGKAKDSNETFYAGIFADRNYTTLSDQVSENIVALNLAGGSEASYTVMAAIEKGESVTLYVTETDASGKTIVGAQGFAYDVSVSATSVTLDETHAGLSVVITNAEQEVETETEIETEKEKKTPRTGDDTPVAMYLSLMLAAAMVFLIEEERRRRSRR